jgi:hypothetical protein
VRSETRSGPGLVLAVGFLFDLEIFLKMFLIFPPDFFSSQIVYRPLLVRVREGVGGFGVRFILNITTAVRIANQTRRTVPVRIATSKIKTCWL